MTFGEVAAALGLLTPLVLGVLAFYKDMKKKSKDEPSQEKPEPIVQGMTVPVDYAAEFIATMKKNLRDTEVERDAALDEVRILKSRLDTYRDLDRR